MYASHNDVVEGNPASPVKVLIYEDLQCGDCARFRAHAGRENSAEVRIEGRVYPPRFSAWESTIGRGPAAVAARWVWDRITNTASRSAVNFWPSRTTSLSTT